MKKRAVCASWINGKRLISTFTDLLRINAPSFGEEAIGAYLRKGLRQAGCTVETQAYEKSFNLIGRLQGSIRKARPLILNAHMDTIEPTTGIRFENKKGVIRTTGRTVLGADDKSALAQILEALLVLREKKVGHGPLEIVFTSAEEKGLHGARNLAFAKLKATHALVLDLSGSVGKIVIAAPTHLTYDMRVSGRSAHAGIEPEKGISAIRVASKIIAALPDSRIDQETTANIGVISGGTATNVVPAEVVIHGEIRGHDAAVLRGLKQEITGKAKAVAAGQKARVRISWNEEYRSFRICGEDPFLAYLAAIFRKNGLKPLHTVTGGGSDANIFQQKGIHAINISNGMQKVHSLGEQISVEDLKKGCLVLLAAVADFKDFAG